MVNDNANNGDAAAPPTSSNAQNNAFGNNPTSSRSNMNRGRNNRSTNNIMQSSEGASFEGACPDIGGILGLRSERINKKLPFSVFTEKLADYVGAEIKYGRDLETCIKLMQDPRKGFEERHKPPPLTVEEPTFDDKYLQQEKLKRYITRETHLEENISKVYSIVWRQCTSALQAVIKGVDGYGEKAAIHDLVWLLKEIKKVVSGVDAKSNPHETLLEALLTLFNMRQQPNETNDHYLTRFKANVHTVEMAKGGHVFCSHELLSCVDDDAPTDVEISREEKKMKAIILLKRPDESRYKSLLEDLKKGAHRGRDEYPTTVTDAFDLMNRDSDEL